jgi:hypothetical protein
MVETEKDNISYEFESLKHFVIAKLSLKFP